MTEKLTLADCFKYPEAKIIKYDILNSGCTEIYDNIIRLIQHYEIGFKLIVGGCQLILRDISQLTDEEEYELELFDDYPEIINDTELKGATGDVKFSDKLREWNIDIDGMIKSGKAVKDV